MDSSEPKGASSTASSTINPRASVALAANHTRLIANYQAPAATNKVVSRPKARASVVYNASATLISKGKLTAQVNTSGGQAKSPPVEALIASSTKAQAPSATVNSSSSNPKANTSSTGAGTANTGRRNTVLVNNLISSTGGHSFLKAHQAQTGSMKSSLQYPKGHRQSVLITSGTHHEMNNGASQEGKKFPVIEVAFVDP